MRAIALLALVALAPHTLTPCFMHNLQNRAADTHVFAEHNVTHVSLTLSWQETTPAPRQLMIAVFNATPTSSGRKPISPWASGPSPLTLDATLAPAHEDETRLVFVASVPHSRDPYVSFGTEQPFTVTGTLTHN